MQDYMEGHPHDIARQEREADAMPETDQEQRDRLWNLFREAYGPRPGGRGAQEVWEQDWLGYFVTSWDLQPKTLGTLQVGDDDDGGYDQLSARLVPAAWKAEEIQKWVDLTYPAQHCQHSYDCCGHTYGGRGRWAYGPEMYLGEWKLITVLRSYRVNI